MNSKNAIRSLAVFAVLSLGGVMAFNYYIDSQCYYRCGTISVENRTLNRYYKVAQTIVAQPDAQLVILGSSRGESTSPLWVEKVTGLKTLNLSASGSELTSKLAFLNIAIENTKVQKVIWLADYFELITKNRDIKIKNTPALRKYLNEDSDNKSWAVLFSDVQGLLNHNTTEASIHFLNHHDETVIDQGAGSEIDFEKCQDPGFKGKRTQAELQKEIEMIYQSYSHEVLVPPQDEREWNTFKKMVGNLESRGIDLTIVIPPYHPEFVARLKKEHPEIYERHLVWVKQLLQLKSKTTHVVEFFGGVPQGDETPVYWDDGIHFTCKAAMIMLKDVVASSEKK